MRHSGASSAGRVTCMKGDVRGLLLGLAMVLGVAPAHAQDVSERFPNTSDSGRAAVEYEDDTVQVVAAYYYSQRQHDSRWLLIEIGVNSPMPMRIHRDDITLVTPDGEAIQVASQRLFAEDVRVTRLLQQNARPTRHPISSYFRTQSTDHFHWFVLTAAEGTVTDVLDVDERVAAWGDLYFASPTGAWEAGTYSLVVEGDGEVLAMLPIELD